MHIQNSGQQTQHNDERISIHDLISINAIIEQLATTRKFHRENSYFLLETEFNIPNVKHMKRSDFDRAIVFLVELQNISGMH